YKFAFPDGRDFLVCRGGSTFQGESTYAIFMAAFDAAGRAITSKLISTSDTGDTCLGDITFSPKQPGQSGAPAESAEISGLTIEAVHGTSDCTRAQSGEEKRKIPREMKFYMIKFLFDGEHFKVAPASRAALSSFDTN
ncbi:MAG: hypothetical protein WAK91_06955, partial [Candidatus Acidiferrales bacterium]